MFCVASGQKISLKKSSIAFSAGVDEERAQKISRASGILVKAQLAREISWSPLHYGKNKLGSLPTSNESHIRQI